MKIPFPFNILLNLRIKKRPKHCNAPKDYICYEENCKNCHYKKHQLPGIVYIAFFILMILYILTE